MYLLSLSIIEKNFFYDLLLKIIRYKEYIPLVVFFGSIITTDLKIINEAESKEELLMSILEWLVAYLIVLVIFYLILFYFIDRIPEYLLTGQIELI